MTQTREEAISNLESLYNEIYNEDSDGYTYAEAIDMAIEALKANVVSRAVSREDYHNLLTALDDIDKALREYQAKEEQLSAEAASREPLDIFARMYRAERESARSGDAEAVSADRPHGEWIEKNSHTYICNHCGFEQAIYGNLDEYNYCPNCGAKIKAR